jgi:hypothetical protein
MQPHELTRAVVHAGTASVRTSKAWLIPGFSEVLEGLRGGPIESDQVPEAVATSRHNMEGHSDPEPTRTLDGRVEASDCAGVSLCIDSKGGRQSWIGRTSMKWKEVRPFSDAQAHIPGSGPAHNGTGAVSTVKRTITAAMRSVEPGDHRVANRKADSEVRDAKPIGFSNAAQPQTRLPFTPDGVTPVFLSTDVQRPDSQVVHESAGPSRDVAESEKTRIVEHGTGERLVQHVEPTDTLSESSARSTVAASAEPPSSTRAESKAVDKTNGSQPEFAARSIEGRTDGSQPAFPGLVRLHESGLRAESVEVKAPALPCVETIERGRPEANSAVLTNGRPRPKAIESMHPGTPQATGLSTVQDAVISANAHPGLQLYGSGQRFSQPTPAASSAGKDAFAALDREQDNPTVRWLHATPQRAEAGFRDPSLGWVSVRAQADRSGVRAFVVPESPDAAQVLKHHLGALNAQLADGHTIVHTVTMSAPEENSRGGGLSGGMPDQKDSEAGARQKSPEEGEADRQLAPRTTAAHAASPAASAFSMRPSGSHISVVA